MRGRVDGLLVMSPYMDAPAVLDDSLPLVLINSQCASEGVASLGVDNYGGAFAMVEHLVDERAPPHRLHRRAVGQLRRP